MNKIVENQLKFLTWTPLLLVQKKLIIAKSNRYKNKLLVSSHINKNNNRPKLKKKLT
jgi:hypothetical protein